MATLCPSAVSLVQMKELKAMGEHSKGTPAIECFEG